MDYVRKRALQVLTDDRKQVLEFSTSVLDGLELRETLHQLGEMVGAVYTDDLLDRIFSRFCLGK